MDEPSVITKGDPINNASVFTIIPSRHQRVDHAANRSAFQLWFGIGVPTYALIALILAFLINRWYGVITGLWYVARILDTAGTTCTRCPNYATWNCGLPGKVVPLVVKRNKKAISQRRLKIHYYVDLFAFLYAWFPYSIYAFRHNSFWSLPVFATLYLIGCWEIVFRRKRYHGLLFRLQ